MTKRNIFIAALESEAQGTVGVADVITEQQDFQPKPGVGEEKGGEPSLDDVKADKEFGEDADIADHDDVDTVAESQEHTLALEQLKSGLNKLSIYATALEELAEQVQDRVETNAPMSASDVAMLTTALDASGIGDSMSENVAVEAFEFSAMVATEGFAETLKDRAGRVAEGIVKYVKNMRDQAVSRMGTFAAGLKPYPSVYKAIADKKIDTVVGFSGRNFEDTKLEKSIQKKIYAPSNCKSPLIALKQSIAAFEACVSQIDGPLSAAMNAAGRSYTTDELSKIPATINKVMDEVAALTKKHSVDSAFTTFKVSIDDVKVTAENANKVRVGGLKRKPVESTYDHSLKIISKEEYAEYEKVLEKAMRIFATAVGSPSELNKALGSKFVSVIAGTGSTSRNRQVIGGVDGVLDFKNAWSTTKVAAAYRYAMASAAYAASSTELGLAEAVYRNCIATMSWANASIKEAERAKKKVEK